MAVTRILAQESLEYISFDRRSDQRPPDRSHRNISLLFHLSSRGSARRRIWLNKFSRGPVQNHNDNQNAQNTAEQNGKCFRNEVLHIGRFQGNYIADFLQSVKFLHFFPFFVKRTI